MTKKIITEEQLREIARESNKKERILKEICSEYDITDKTFQNKYKQIGIVFDKTNKLYIIPGEPINGQLDLLEGNEQHLHSRERALTTTIDQPLLKQNTEEPKSKGRPQIHQEGDLIRKTFIITPELERALKLKSANEDIGLNELVRDLLEKSIERKYFKGL